MTRDDIIRMAHKQGDFLDSKHGGAFIFNSDPEDTFNIFKFAALVAKQEREACIKSLENIAAKAQEISPSGLVWRTVQECANAIRERGASMTNEDITNNKPDQPAVWINYIMLHSFASEYKVPYNELCRVVRAAVARLDLSEEHQ